MNTLKQLAHHYQIAETCILELIRNKKISSHADLHSVYIDPKELEEYFNNHPDYLKQKQEAFNITQSHLIKY